MKSVLKFWIEFDVENLVWIKNGIQQFKVPSDYETNKTKVTGIVMQGVWRFREDTFPVVRDRLIELLWIFATNYNYADDMLSAVIHAMELRHLQGCKWQPGHLYPEGLHNKLNELFQMRPGGYAYEAYDLLLKMVKDELARHPARPSRTFRLGETARSTNGRLLINTIDNNTNDPQGPRGTTRGWADCGPARYEAAE